MTFLALFILIAGFIIGLGAVTVIDIHGFLGRKSSYWSEATTRTHKVTKPLIWVGISLVLIGSLLIYSDELLVGQLAIIALLVLNGLFLSFRVSPYLLEQERLGKATEVLPASWQRKIMVSMIMSDIGWWGSVAILCYHLTS